MGRAVPADDNVGEERPNRAHLGPCWEPWGSTVWESGVPPALVGHHVPTCQESECPGTTAELSLEEMGRQGTHCTGTGMALLGPPGLAHVPQSLTWEQGSGLPDTKLLYTAGPCHGVLKLFKTRI